MKTQHSIEDALLLAPAPAWAMEIDGSDTLGHSENLGHHGHLMSDSDGFVTERKHATALGVTVGVTVDVMTLAGSPEVTGQALDLA